MIKANELMIGNYVKPISPRHEERYIQIESIANDKINIEFRDYQLTEIEPISLTPEIFNCLEFNVMPGEIRWYAEGNAYFWGYIDDGEFIQETELPFVHQLQNLYFALTAEELEISLIALKQTA